MLTFSRKKPKNADLEKKGFDPYEFERIHADLDERDSKISSLERLTFAMIAILIYIAIVLLLTSIQPMEKVSFAIYSAHGNEQP